jgi:hypothetical protein
MKGGYQMNKIIQELNLPGATTRPVVIMSKPKSSSPVQQVEIQLEFEFLKEGETNSTDKEE